MQLSVKTPSDLALRLLEKCTIMDLRYPSAFVTDCAWECLRVMNLPHREFHPLELVGRYYYAVGRENEIYPSSEEKLDGLLHELAQRSRAERSQEAVLRLKKFKAERKRQPAPKNLALKISAGIDDLPKRIKEKAVWLRLSPNALVMACLRDCLDAMDDPLKALQPPEIVRQYWEVSHARSRQKPADAIDAMIMKNLDGTLRRRGGPILDTVIRFALNQQWNVTLKQILTEADALVPLD